MAMMMGRLSIRTRANGPASSGFDVRALLLACVHQDPGRLDTAALSALDERGWQRLLEIAAIKRVQPLLQRRLRASDVAPLVPISIRRALERACRRITAQNLHLHSELAAVVASLAAVGVPVIVLKGAHVAQAMYGNLALREMGDLDLIVRREHLTVAAGVLRSRGYAQAGGHPLVDDNAAICHHLPGFVRPPSASVELHWNITTPRRPYSIDPGELWTRAVPIRIAGADTLSLSVEDLLLHLCCHVAYQHRFDIGLLPFCDIAETIRRRREEIDWECIRRRAEQWNWTRGVHLALQLARDLVGANVPSSLLRSLAPRDLRVGQSHLAGARAFVLWQDARPPRGLLPLAGPGSLWSKCRLVGRRVFLSQVEITQAYRLPVDSPLVVRYGLYFVRLRDLLRRYGCIGVRALASSSSELTPLAEYERVERLVEL